MSVRSNRKIRANKRMREKIGEEIPLSFSVMLLYSLYIFLVHFLHSATKARWCTAAGGKWQ